MSKSKRDRYRTERAHLKHLSGLDPDPANDDWSDDPTDSISTTDAEATLEFLDAKDPENVRVSNHIDDGTKSDSTLARYANLLKRTAHVAEFELTDADADDINGFIDDLRSGEADGVKDDGLSDGTVKTFQSTYRRFYEYHADIGVEKTDIVMFTNTDSPVDERDLYTKEEIGEIRDAASHPRDKCLVDLLLYTGQRLSAILNLRIKDVDTDEGVFYLNGDAGELKGASGKRPLLYAEKGVRDWVRQHPVKDDREAHLITHKYDWKNKPYEAGERLDNSTVYRQLQRIGEAAGVDKPMNAHNFRHTFVTVCKRDYGMDNDTIKRLIGHRPDSQIMETTYAHLTDDDVIAAAERATDLRDDEPDSPLTPDVCDNCGEPVTRDNAKACDACGIVFTPDAQTAKDNVESDLKTDYRNTDPADEETMEKLDTLDAMLDDPEVKAALLDKIGD